MNRMNPRIRCSLCRHFRGVLGEGAPSHYGLCGLKKAFKTAESYCRYFEPQPDTPQPAPEKSGEKDS